MAPQGPSLSSSGDAGEYAEILLADGVGPQVAACSGAVWETVGGAAATEFHDQLAMPGPGSESADGQEL